MPSNVITINNQIRYDVPDDKMEKLLKYLDAIGQRVTHENPLKDAWVSARGLVDNAKK